ncbi:hypothetical protein MKEN_01250800 [Mycena kentingensis (nom. inval.)]|nr:hypothetical protein MKEN_01250800 [Mycena kentingensis (nom. inval.)]
MNDPCPAPMNTDISGIGVRISFYLQTLFLSCLSARSGSLEEIMSSLYTLLFTNTAMAVTALILGFKPLPEISLQDAIVVFYLLLLSWTTVTLTLPACARFPAATKHPRTARSLTLLHILSVIQSYLIFGFALALLGKAPTFGIRHECNSSARAFLFHPFPALGAGRIVGLVLTPTLVLGYSAVLVRDHLPPQAQDIQKWIQRKVLRRVPDVDRANAEAARSPHSQPQNPFANGPSFGMGTGIGIPPLPRIPRRVPGKGQYQSRAGAKAHAQLPSYDLQIEWPLLIHLFVVFVLWSLVVMNTELLIQANNDGGTEGSGWGFGQILPMFLVLLPLANVINAFREFGIKPHPPSLLLGVGLEQAGERLPDGMV